VNRPQQRALALVTGLALLGGTAGCGVLGDQETKQVSALFERTVGVYEQSDVRILGVKIGSVTDIRPEGDKVRVDMEYDAKYDLPEDAKALVVAPSIVSDRYVQITPAYTGGPVLAEGSVLGLDRTDVPLELDEVYSAIDELNVALGPNGANKDGALSDLLKVSAQNLEGNGELLGSTLEDFSQAVDTLAGQRDDLFGTVRNLQDFTTTIAGSDETVRAFNRDLAAVADQLAGEREDLATAVRQLSVALGDVATFVQDNREGLRVNVQNLADVTGALIENQVALKEFIDVAPTALSNLQLAYNPSTGTLDTRDNGPAQIEGMPLAVLCPLLEEADAGLPLGDLGAVLDQAAAVCNEQFGGSPPAEGGGGSPLPPLPIPGVGAASTAGAPVAVPVPADRSLGGLLMGTR
jgi:phospholipid/cholesterol/gamma-HCH transport system substrate-binding protein